MEKKRIALVDSSVDVNLYKNNIVGSYSLLNSDKHEMSNNHGTLCCSAILKINPLAEIYTVTALDQNNRSSSETILDALHYLSNTSVDIINLSLSTDNIRWEKDYKKVISKICNQGKIVIASLANNHAISIPARLPEVIGVQGNIFRDPMEYWFNRRYEIQSVANAIPQVLKGNQGTYELFGGNSKATAVFTGIVSKIGIDSRALENYLEIHAKKKEWTDIHEEEPEISLSERNEHLFMRLRKTIIQVLRISKENENKLENEKLFRCGLTRNNAIILLKEIEKEFHLKIDYDSVNLFWFYSLESLYYKIFNNKGKSNE